jgi:radical SAM protein with 4Fe4S-binding SPASM domain
MPVAASIELTNHCNLQCPECPSGSGSMTRGKGFMDIGLYRKVMSEIEPYLLWLNLYFQGEPMMHPEFFSFLSVRTKCRKTVSTNGHFLTPENAYKLVGSDLSKLIISLDGMNSPVYNAYRSGGDFEKVIEGIQNVAKARKQNRSSMDMEIQFLVSRKNEHQIPLARKYAREIKASLRLKSMQINSREEIGEWLPEQERFRRYEPVNGTYKIKSSLPDRCPRLWFNPVVTWDGKVVPCCFDKNAEHVMGDLNEESFREIWNNQKFINFRQKIISDRSSVAMCNNCTSGLSRRIIC